MSNKKSNTQLTSINSYSVLGTFTKAFDRKASWPEKDEFLDVVYWIRQILGLLFGLTWGIISMQGIVSIVGFFAISTFIIYLYYNNYQTAIDEDEFGGFSEILKEGLMTSFATFLVSWIILYSALYFE